MAIISSHTLNGSDGTHAGGISVRLENLQTGMALFSSEMDEGGRLNVTVDISDQDPNTSYQIIFDTTAYWETRNVGAPSVTEIVLRFKMPDNNARYHMPLILSPNSYSCWVSIPEV